MFSQVLICVWREVLEFIIHPTGGGHGPGRLPAPEPASWLYWHVPSVMNAAQVHLRNSLVRQPSRERSAERRHSASAAAARRSRLALGGQEGTNWNWGRKASVFLSVFLIFLLSFSNPSLPLNTVLPLGNYWHWRKEHRHAAFQQQDRFGLLFCFLTRWDNDQVKLVLRQVQVRGEGKWVYFLLQPFPRDCCMVTCSPFWQQLWPPAQPTPLRSLAGEFVFWWLDG